MSANTLFGRISFPRIDDEEKSKSDETARAQGHAAGYAAGLRAAMVEIDRIKFDLQTEREQGARLAAAKMDRGVRVLNAAAEALDQRMLPVLIDAESTLVACALQLTEAIIGNELSRTEPSARRALDRAMRAVEAGDTAKAHSIRMNPDDLPLLDATTVRLSGVTFVADAEVNRGDAIAEFSEGILDARIETALARAREILLADIAGETS
ncbi:FliH/SctL family protein [Cryobacterium sp. Y11]|uniref:FliH/SctL family protein n=1 Tax=Cryobacterium sp. Y11 TaxID=2045016 RepID=UPI0013049B9E|nr:FliH/SctL family protein [Cryobacterium sp. Y11]